MSLSERQLAELTMVLLADRAIAALADERDDDVALSKALLVLTALSQATNSSAAHYLSKYILKSFAPLRSRLTNGNLEVWKGHTIGVRVDNNGDPVVAVRKDTMNDLWDNFSSTNADEQQRLLSQVRASSDDDATTYWPKTAERYVGFFDIMGFSAHVKTAGDDHERLYNLLLELHAAGENAMQMMSRGDEYSQTLSKTHVASGQLRAVQFSDSIVAITEDASPASSLLIEMASNIFFLRALQSGIVLRGAIAKGQVTADFKNSIFFGQPIIDAYRLEESQQWYGIAFHSSTVRQGPTDAKPIGKGEIPLAVTHAVHLKGEADPHDITVLNWPVIVRDEQVIKQMLAPFDGSQSPEPQKLGEYHRRTLEFAISMCRRFWGSGKRRRSS